MAIVVVACGACRTADTIVEASAQASVAGAEDPQARALALEAERRLTDPLAGGELDGKAARRAFEREGRAWARDQLADRVPGAVDPVQGLGMPESVGPATLDTNWRGARMVWQQGDVYGWQVVGRAGVETLDPDPYAEIHMTRRLPGGLKGWGPVHVEGSTRSSGPLGIENQAEVDSPSVSVWITRDF